MNLNRGDRITILHSPYVWKVVRRDDKFGGTHGCYLVKHPETGRKLWVTPEEIISVVERKAQVA